MIAAAGPVSAAPARAASAEHVLAHQPWARVTPVTDGDTRLVEIACHCGRSTHVGEITPWTPQAADATVEVPSPRLCLSCGRPLAATAHFHVQYHRACAQTRERARLKQRKIAAAAMRGEAEVMA